ncbi:putative transcriptional regulator [Rhodoligotrophos appendicifer]|uniref:MucR family transcriptional regulator n=1 Tax=Rhodoligotrophos appendicifer TaxID=987056 RepID=UPI0011864450|nr:MucR family transcriptional regulator [Rhodoligotrophos appendicifer]
MDSSTGNDIGEGKGELAELTAEIVAAYVANNAVPSESLPSLIKDVYRALNGTMEPEEKQVAELKPAVPVRRSVTPDYIICLEDGKKFKSLKRHLRTQYEMTPEQYREKWALPSDYPMVAPNYAAARSDLAKQMGLGQKKRRARAAK